MLNFPISNGFALRVDSNTGPVVIDLADANNNQVLVLDANWSPAVFNSNAKAWLLDLVARINAFLTQFLSDTRGPQDQASLEAWIQEKVAVDPNTGLLSVK